MTSDTSKQHHDTPVDTADAPGGFSSLPLDVISTHILRSDFLPEPGDLGRLRAVSRRMRDAVDATGREIKKLSDMDAMHLGYVSLLKDRHSRGLLEDECLLCGATASGEGVASEDSSRSCSVGRPPPRCERSFGRARTADARGRARGTSSAWAGGHLETLKWARENGCPWNVWTCTYAARGGQLETLKWARENGCPWNKTSHLETRARENGWAAEGRPPRDAEVGA